MFLILRGLQKKVMDCFEKPEIPDLFNIKSVETYSINTILSFKEYMCNVRGVYKTAQYRLDFYAENLWEERDNIYRYRMARKVYEDRLSVPAFNKKSNELFLVRIKPGLLKSIIELEPGFYIIENGKKKLIRLCGEVTVQSFEKLKWLETIIAYTYINEKGKRIKGIRKKVRK